MTPKQLAYERKKARRRRALLSTPPPNASDVLQPFNSPVAEHPESNFRIQQSILISVNTVYGSDLAVVLIYAKRAARQRSTLNKSERNIRGVSNSEEQWGQRKQIRRNQNQENTMTIH